MVGQSGFALGLDIRKDIIEFAEANCKKWKEKHSDKIVNVSFELRNCFLVDPKGLCFFFPQFLLFPGKLTLQPR